MALMERVATLLRANVNDLIDRAEDPEKMLKQLLLDMENQLLQVKTQVAAAIADEHMLQMKAQEHADQAVMWNEMATMAVKKGDDEVARQALDRNLSSAELCRAFSQQLQEHREDTAELRKKYLSLEAKLRETRGQAELLTARHQRARRTGKMPQVGGSVASDGNFAVLRKMREMVGRQEAVNHADRALAAELGMGEPPMLLKREDDVEKLLLELKEQRQGMLEAG